MSEPTHEEIQELLGAYALHALDPEEQAIVEEHLEDCPRCQQEVREHREVAALLGNSGGVAPEGVWDRIAGQLEETPPPMRLPLPEPSSEVVPLAHRRREPRRGLLAAALGAAAALVIGVLGAQVVRQDSRIQDLEAAMDGSTLPQSADASVATLSSSDGALTAEAVLLPNGTGYLLAKGLPGLPQNQTYQLWGVTDSGVISLGLLGTDPGQVLPFQAGDQVTALAVTQEVAGGVVQSENPAVVAGELG